MSNFTEMHENSQKQDVTNTYSLSGTLCAPKNGAKNPTHVQYLIHGVGFDSSYWDFAAAPEYSYVRAAAEAGYTTFRYDRLGTGLSEKPADAYKCVSPFTLASLVADGVGQCRAVSDRPSDRDQARRNVEER